MKQRPKSRTQVIKALMEIDRYDITDVAVNVCTLQSVLKDVLHWLQHDVSVISELESCIRLLKKKINTYETQKEEWL